MTFFRPAWRRTAPALIAVLALGGAPAPRIALAAPAATTATPTAPPAGAIAIEADQGIEWQRQARLVIARGNAQAVRGDMQLNAQVLTAHYRERTDGSTEVWKIDAEGDVILKTPGETAFGERGNFNFDKNLMTLTGGTEVGVTTAGSRITARKEITYDTRTRTMIARGDAVAVEEDRTLHGDVITVYLRDKPAEGQSRMRRLEAERNVRLLTGGDDIRADRGTYDVDSGQATMTGSVKILRGPNVLTGCRGEANLKTGVSTLFACTDERRGSTRVQGVILPEAAKKP
jgi:lipopolysaccharide export system protein LptA